MQIKLQKSIIILTFLFSMVLFIVGLITTNMQPMLYSLYLYILINVYLYRICRIQKQK